MGRSAPWLVGEEPRYAGPFHKNIFEFLDARATPVATPAWIANTRAWVVPLQASDGPVNLHVYQESYDDDPTAAACDQCRIIGAPPLLGTPHQGSPGTAPMPRRTCKQYVMLGSLRGTSINSYILPCSSQAASHEADSHDATRPVSSRLLANPQPRPSCSGSSKVHPLLFVGSLAAP